MRSPWGDHAAPMSDAFAMTTYGVPRVVDTTAYPWRVSTSRSSPFGDQAGQYENDEAITRRAVPSGRIATTSVSHPPTAAKAIQRLSGDHDGAPGPPLLHDHQCAIR